MKGMRGSRELNFSPVTVVVVVVSYLAGAYAHTTE